jgi:hypothetical protein
MQKEIVGAREEDPPEDLDIERDVYHKMPVEVSVIKPTVIRDHGNAKPSIILPEGIEDE